METFTKNFYKAKKKKKRLKVCFCPCPHLRNIFTRVQNHVMQGPMGYQWLGISPTFAIVVAFILTFSFSIVK